MFSLSYVYLTIELLIIGLNVVTMLALARGKVNHGQQLLTLSIVCSTIQNIGYLLQINVVSYDACTIAIKVQYIGSCFAALFFLCFISYYFRRPIKQNTIIFLAAIDTIILMGICGIKGFKLLYKSVTFVAEPYAHMQKTYGPLFYCFLIFCCVIPLTYIVILTIRAYKQHTLVLKQTNVKSFVALLTVPVWVLVGYMITNRFVNFDPCPLVYALAVDIAALRVWKNTIVDTEHIISDTIVERIDEAVLATDNRGLIVYCNTAAKKQFGHIENEYLQTVPKLQTTDYHDGDIIQYADNYLKVTIKPIVDKNGICCGNLYTYSNITELKTKAEEAIRANAEKDAVIARVAHEIRTPLNAVLGLSNHLLETKTFDEVILRKIKNAGTGSLQIVNEVLDYSKLISGEQIFENEKYKIKDILSDIASFAETMRDEKPIRITLDVSQCSDDTLVGTKDAIVQIITILASNAIKYTDGGSVNFTASSTGDNPKTIRIEVNDTGKGIPEELLKDIFKPFISFSEDYNANSAGLGLPIAKELAKKLGSEIRVNSKPGKGSSFWFEYVQSIAMDERQNTGAIPSGLNALIVDDNKLNQMVLSVLLKQHGFTIDMADDGAEAVRKSKEKIYDIIFMDHLMPVMDGIEATKAIRTFNIRTPIIMVTANAVGDNGRSYYEAGIDSFIPKPIDTRVLNNLLQKTFCDA